MARKDPVSKLAGGDAAGIFAARRDLCDAMLEATILRNESSC